jgi:hypothetical protein
MEKGAVLTVVHDPKLPRGRQYYVSPGGKVDDQVAERLQALPNVKVDSGGLFPGCPQSWRLKQRR